MKKVCMISVLFLLTVFTLAGCKDATAEVEGEALNYEEVKEKVKEAEKELDKVNSELDESKGNLKENKDELAELKELRDNRDSMKQEIDEGESTLEGLNNDIDTAEEELETLNEEIVKVTDEPVKLSAGQWIVGTDIPAARYKASGSSNFFVYDSSGSIMVNTILGDSSVGKGDYVFFAEDGYIIESSAAATLTPVE